MSTAEMHFRGEMYVELTLLANRFWSAAPDNAKDGDHATNMGCRLDRAALDNLLSIPDEEIQDHWRTEYHNRYRQSLDIPF